ncbi:MAG: WG repeat-containing protein [Bacteroidota bacterium]
MSQGSTSKSNVNFWLNIFSQRPVYIIFSGIIVISFAVLGVAMLNCWTKTHDINEMLNCMTGSLYHDITEVVIDPADKRTTDEEWKPVINPRFELPEGKMIEEDISDLQAKWYQRYGGLIKLLIVVSLLTFLVLYEIYKHWRRRFFYKLEDEDNVGYLWSIKAKEEDVQLYRTQEFEEASNHLLAENTASSTEETTMVPARTFKYLVLIEKLDKEDHLAMLYDQVMMDLTKQRVEMERFFYQDDPRLVFKEKYKKEFHLDQLQAEYPEHKLIILGQAESFFDALTDGWDAWTRMLSKWKRVIVMTPKVPLAWGHREVVLSKKYTLLPATLKAIGLLPQILAEGDVPPLKYWINENEYPAPPDLDSPELIEELKLYFDTTYEGLEEHYHQGAGKDMFKWLCATAVYAELSWDLTLALGNSLNKMGESELVTPPHLYRIASLDWFRDGIIPEEKRALLLAQLDEESLTITRETIIELLHENTPPPHTYAAALHQLQLAVQEAQLHPSIQKHLSVVQMVQDFSLNHELTDPTVQAYLREYPKNLPNIPIPENVSEYIFESGAPALGMQSWVRITLGIAFVLLILLTLDPTRLDKVQSFRNRDYFISNDDARMRFHAFKGNTYLTEGNLDAAEREYEESLFFGKTSSGKEYLIAEYNLNLVKLNQGRRGEAEAGFDEVANKVDRFLADNVDPKMPREKAEEVKSKTGYIRGLLDYEAGDIVAANEQFSNIPVQTTRFSIDAVYAKAVLSLEKGISQQTEGIQQDNNIRLALNGFEEIAQKEPGFFEKNGKVLSVLDSLQANTPNQALKQRIGESLDIIRTGRKKDIETPENVDTAVQTATKKEKVMQYVTDFREGKAIILDGKKVGFVDTLGSMASDQMYDDARTFHGGLAAVKREGKWGYINTNFHAVIPYQFDNARDFQEGFASVKIDGKWGLIDEKGELALPYTYQYPILFDYPDLRPKGAEAMAVIRTKNGYQYINRKGEVLFDGARFRHARNFMGDKALVKRWNKVFEIGRDGQCIPSEKKECPQERWRHSRPIAIKGHAGDVYEGMFSPNGKFVVTASDDSTVRISGANGQQLQAVLLHKSKVRSLEVSPNSRRIASASQGGELNIWTAEGALVKSFFEPKQNLISLSWSPNGKWLICGSANGKIYLYNMAKLILANVFDTSSDGAGALDFAPNSKTFAAGLESGLLQIWNLQGEVMKEIDVRSSIESVDYSPDGKQIAVAARVPFAYVYNTEGKNLKILSGHKDWVSQIQYSPDGNYILTASYDQSLRVWNNDGKVVMQIRKPGVIRSASFSADGKAIIVSSRNARKGIRATVYALATY